MSDFIQRLREQRANTWEQTKSLLDAAAAEKRDLSAEEQVQFDKMNGELDAIAERVKGLEEQEKRNVELDAAFAKLGKDEAPAPKVDDMRSALSQRNGSYEVRDLLLAGGAGVIPTGFRAQLWEYAVESAGILQAGVDLLETNEGNSITLPRATAYSTVGATTEGSAITESDPTLGSVSSTVAKRGYVTQVSTELLTDSAFNLEQKLAQWAGRELGNDIGAAAVTAALAAASAGATTAAGTAGGLGAQGTTDRGFDYLITLFHSVIAPYRARSSCSWVMADPTAAMVRKVKSTDGVYAWQPSVVAGQPDTILGKPVYIDTNVPDAAISVESILFGDFSSLVVRIAGGIRFERSDDFAFNADMTTFRALTRHGTVSVDANALKSLTHAGS
jgi:HK97 family phage major capsid protein